MAESVVESSAEAVLNVVRTERIRVLHVDDDQAFLSIAKQCLEMQGEIDVDTASSVYEAYEKLKKKDYDSIVCDYQMPGKDGLEFLKELRANGNNTPFIIFTGKGREEIAVKALNMGVDGYFNKHGEPETVYGELAHGISEVVEKKRIKDALRSSQAKYKSLLQNIPGMVYRARPDWSTEIISNSKSVCGYAIQEFDSRIVSWLDIIHPDDKARVVTEGGIIQEGPASITQEYRIVDKESGVRWVEDHKTSFFSKNGVFEGIDGVVFDVTSRKKTEQALHAGLDRYRLFIEVTEDLGWTTNANGEVLEDIPSFGKFTGQTYDEVKGWGWSKALHPDDVERATRIWREATETRSKYEVEYRLRRHDGVYRYFIARSVPVLREDGSIREWVGTCIDITDRKKAEQTLKESEEKYRNLVELAPDGIIVMNNEGIITSVNRSFLTLVGYGSEEEIVSKPFTELKTIRAEDLPKFQEMFVSLMKSESLASFEFFYSRKDGTSRWAEMHLGLLKKNGNTTGIQVIMRDISERKNAEKLIQENQQKFEQLFMSNPEPAVYVDPNERVLNVNPRFTELFGYSSDEVKGKFLDDFMVPEDRREEALMLAQKGKEGYIYYETVRKSKKGSLIPVTMSSAPIVLQGQHSGDIVLYMDITERKRTEETLEKSEERLRSIVENSSDQIFMLDRDCRFLSINKTAADLFGASPQEMVGMSISEIFPEAIAAQFLENIKNVFDTGKSMFIDEKMVVKDHELYNSTSLNPVRDDRGSVIAVTGIVRDVTERKKAEEKLKENGDRIEMMNEKLRVVGSLTRHDVRNKLSAVTGYAYLLKKKHADQADIVDGLGKMEQAVKEVGKIFDFARMYEQLGVEELTYVDVEKTLDEAVALFSGLTIKVVNGCHGLTVLADSFLRQLFYNFIDNTGKYGGKATAARVYYEKAESGELRLVYEDDGVGISAENKLKLFTEGFSAGGSTGFGLFLIRKMMDVYGWQIQETGEPGKGTKFVIAIPKANLNRKGNYQLS